MSDEIEKLRQRTENDQDGQYERESNEGCQWNKKWVIFFIQIMFVYTVI